MYNQPSSTAPTVGQKRAKPSDAFTPVHKQRPRFSAACLAQLCTDIVDDGLMQLPSSYDVSGGDNHVELARDTGFRACVLRSCASLLEDAQAAATSALLLQDGSTAEGRPLPAAAEVLELGPALFKVAKVSCCCVILIAVSCRCRFTTCTGNDRARRRRDRVEASQRPAGSCAQISTLWPDSCTEWCCWFILFCTLPLWSVLLQLVMRTAIAGGRPSSKPTSSGGGSSNEGRKAAGTAASGDGCETLEHLSASALLQLLKLAEATQQLPALFAKLPLEDGSLPAGAQGSSSSSSGSDAAGSVVAAVMPRLPQLLSCTDSLLQQGCFKETQVMVECLALLGRCLGAPVTLVNAAAQQQQQPQQQQAGQQQQQQKEEEPAYAALSRWAHEALQQEEPEVKSVPLVRALLELYIRFHGAPWPVIRRL